jgi:tRNA nucleotidyltransferase (CCA-adding enzyme)
MSFSKKFASIKLDEIESKITNLLLSVTENLKGSHPNLTLRIAGGWVRDKLLGIPSHDIDIALNDMSGIDFATCIYEFSKSFDSSIVGSHVSKIKSNPNKSKHLETATVKLFGLDVDFVHLRSESYTEGSRIPTIAFGTPKEDASRRDLTINSLFYNIHTGKIEDFLEMGLSDLENGIIRTPLDPFDTFKDDPLRILRTIRFASRFEFTIIDQIRDAVKNPVIRVHITTNFRMLFLTSFQKKE